MMLEVKGLTKRFGGLLAVSAVDLEVAKGEIVSLIGPNGAGKTTLFASISGFLKLDEGAVNLDGHSIMNMKSHKICQQGMVRTFQITQPFATLNTLENIMVGAYANTSSKKIAQMNAERVADILGMTSLLYQTAGLNPTEIDEIVEVIKGIRDNGVTIFLIEHVMKAVVNLSDRTYVLNDGKLIAQGTPQSVASDPVVIEAYLGHGAAKMMANGDKS